MRKAGRKFLLTLRRSRQLPQPRLERIGHGVEILRQIAELVIGADRDAPVRLPGRKLPRRARNAAEGPRHIDRQSCRCRDRSPKHSGKDPSKALQFRLRFAQHVRNVVQASQRVCTAVQCKQRRCDQAAAGGGILHTGDDHARPSVLRRLPWEARTFGQNRAVHRVQAVAAVLRNSLQRSFDRAGGSGVLPLLSGAERLHRHAEQPYPLLRIADLPLQTRVKRAAHDQVAADSQRDSQQHGDEGGHFGSKSQSVTSSR